MTENVLGLESILSWLSENEPRGLGRMVLDINIVRGEIERLLSASNAQGVFDPHRVKAALEAAYWIGRQSLICVACGDYVPPNDTYCDCWRDKR